MASAGRPFTERLLVRLMARGIPVAPLVLHTGVSSPELHEPPYPEQFAVPAATARLVTEHAAGGRRVVAVGTTVTRALETATDDDGVVRPRRGLDRPRARARTGPARAVTGLITGLHAPEASHLQLLEAVAGADLVDAAYRRRRRRALPLARVRRLDAVPALKRSRTSAAERCSSSAWRSAGGRRGHEVHSGPAGSSVSRQHEARRVNRAPATST